MDDITFKFEGTMGRVCFNRTDPEREPFVQWGSMGANLEACAREKPLGKLVRDLLAIEMAGAIDPPRWWERELFLRHADSVLYQMAEFIRPTVNDAHQYGLSEREQRMTTAGIEACISRLEVMKQLVEDL